MEFVLQLVAGNLRSAVSFRQFDNVVEVVQRFTFVATPRRTAPSSKAITVDLRAAVFSLACFFTARLTVSPQLTVRPSREAASDRKSRRRES